MIKSPPTYGTETRTPTPLTHEDFGKQTTLLIAAFRASITETQLGTLYDLLLEEGFDGPDFRGACRWILRNRRTFPYLSDFIEGRRVYLDGTDEG